MTHVTLLALVGFFAGTFGAMVGLGGGVFIVPVLTLFLGVPIHSAVAASLVAVVATSTTAAAAYVREDLANIRLGMTLETMTVTGALIGGLAGAALGKAVLSGIFGAVMIVVSVYMGLRQRTAGPPQAMTGELGRLGASYFDRSLQREVRYRPHRLWTGMIVSFVAGNISGLLGVGGGFLKVPVMILGMKVPARAAVATSSFMIGVTACAGSIVYLAKGLVDPVVTVPVVLGVTAGAYIGSKLTLRVRSSILVTVLAAILFILSVQMILSATGISLR
ncbi:MAG: sulfite exporter TauE/SafE family protein [Actinobacteria bacterium]|nr:sulfite exporter TauE/SafE family protein [Actinomycetota bacterium]